MQRAAKEVKKEEGTIIDLAAVGADEDAKANLLEESEEVKEIRAKIEELYLALDRKQKQRTRLMKADYLEKDHHGNFVDCGGAQKSWM